MKQLTSDLEIITFKTTVLLFTHSEVTISEMARPWERLLLIWKLDRDQADKIKKACS